MVEAADFVLDPGCHLESWPDRLNDLTGLTDGTLRVETAEGGSRPFELRAARVTEASGRVTGICGVTRDVVADEPDAETFQRRAGRLEAAVADVDGPGWDDDR